MTALKGRAIEEFMAKGPGAMRAVLVYGPDQGLARERADHLARRVVADFKDPFNYIELSESDLKGEPGRLADEAAALSFAGGERVVRVRISGEALPPAVATFLDLSETGRLKSNALVLIEAGELGPRAGLRQAFEKAKGAAALPCYVDGPRETRALAVAMAAEEGLAFEEDALELLLARLGEDRALARQEISKLILYKGLKSQRSGPGSIAREDVRALLADGAAEAIDDAAAAAAGGEAGPLARALARSASAGATPVGLLRALWRELSRIKETRARIADGASVAEAMKRLRPPVFFAEEAAFRARLDRWAPARLDAALALVLEAEFAAKTTGAPQREIADQAAFDVARLAGTRR